MRSLNQQPFASPLSTPDHALAYCRKEQRKRTYLSGKLAYGEGALDGAFTLDCAIHDISGSGAQIVLDGYQMLPPDIFLIVVKYCVAYRAKVAWNKFPARGLCFSQSYPFCEKLPAELGFLRRIWLELSPRSGITLN